MEGVFKEKRSSLKLVGRSSVDKNIMVAKPLKKHDYVIGFATIFI